jgi:hypothetical protein
MIAREIGDIHPRAIPKIVEAMEQTHGTSLENHLRKYIFEPLQSLSHPRALIVIIDDMDGWRDHPAFFKALALLNPQSSIVKFILTYRLDPWASRLPGVDNISIYTYALGPMSNGGIKSYFEKHLRTIPWVDGRKANPADVEKLTELSEGLPLWAETVIAKLSYPFTESPPHEILSEIVGSRCQVGIIGRLGEEYRNALRRLFPSSDDQKQFRRYFGTIIVLREAVSVSDFATLTGIPSHLATRIRFALSALAIRYPTPGSENMIHPAAALFHLSFLEYVQAMTTEASFAISTFDSHFAIGLACIHQLRASLPRSSLSLRAIQHYAVKYWPHHTANGTPRLKSQIQSRPELAEHISEVLQITSENQRRWADLFLQSLMPGDAYSMMEDDDGCPGDSMVSILGGVVNSLHGRDEGYWEFRVACLEVAVRIDDRDAMVWSCLGDCYRAWGQRMGSLQLYEQAVVAFRCALQLQTDLHPDRAEALSDVATTLMLCYTQNGIADILTEAISLCRGALALRPAPHPDRSTSLNHLANTLQSFYERNGGVGTLDEVVSLNRQALALRPVHHLDRPVSLNNLANALRLLYQRNGGIATLDEVILLNRSALALLPAPHPDRPTSLNNLASALQSLYESNGEAGTCNEIVSLNREALALCPPAPHPDRSMFLDNLANTLRDLYERNGDYDLLDEGILLHYEALALRPNPHPGRSRTLNNLANTLQSYYKHSGDINLLEEAASLCREALTICPDPHPNRPQSLQNLTNALVSQFKLNDGAVEILNEAISLCREVLVLRPPDARHRKNTLEILVWLLEKRHEVTADGRDLEKIEILKPELDDLNRRNAIAKLVKNKPKYAARLGEYSISAMCSLSNSASRPQAKGGGY